MFLGLKIMEVLKDLKRFLLGFKFRRMSRKPLYGKSFHSNRRKRYLQLLEPFEVVVGLSDSWRLRLPRALDGARFLQTMTLWIDC